jgi:hypothetical protein
MAHPSPQTHEVNVELARKRNVGWPTSLVMKPTPESDQARAFEVCKA